MTDLFQRFRHERILAQDSKSKMITLLGSIDGRNAIIIAEKSAFDVHNLQSVTRPAGLVSDVSNNIYVLWNTS